MQLICFCDNMRKNLVCLLILQFNGLFLSAPNIYTDLNSIWVKCADVWAKVTQMKWTVFMKYVTLEEFTPVLQIVYTFFVFGLNVQMSEEEKQTAGRTKQNHE